MPSAIVASEQNAQDAGRSASWLRCILYVDVPRLFLFALAYFVAVGYGTLFVQTAAAPLWLPDSVLLFALLLAPSKKWWLFIITAIPIRFIPTPHPSVPFWFLAASCANDIVKAVLAAYLLRRLRPAFRLATLSQFAKYVGISVLLVPMLSAVAGATTRHLLGYAFWTSGYQWFLGDALANLILTPALLYWYFQGFRGWETGKAELALGTTGFVVSITLTLTLAHSSLLPIALCIPFPFLVWAAVRLRPIGTATALCIVALLGTARVAEGTLFVMGFESKNLLFLQLFLFVISIPLLSLSILVEERRTVENELRESQHALKQNYEEVQYLAGKLISAQEDERRRIALELHDDLGQRLALLAVHLEALKQNTSDASTTVHDLVRVTKDETQDIGASLRELSHQLHSSALQYLGLPAALRGLCRTHSQQHEISFQVEADELPGMPYDLSLCLFRIAQEALNNAIRHGKADRVVLRLICESNQISLEIRDNGTGFNVSGQPSGLGLIGMRERVRLVNGTISIDTKPMGGTTINVRVPLVSMPESSPRAVAS